MLDPGATASGCVTNSIHFIIVFEWLERNKDDETKAFFSKQNTLRMAGDNELGPRDEKYDMVGDNQIPQGCS